MAKISHPESPGRTGDVVQFRLRPRLSKAALLQLRTYAARQSYDGLRATHSDQEADSFIALAAGHIDGAARYLAEFGALTPNVGAVASISKLNVGPDTETAASKVYADIGRILWTCKVVSGCGTANIIAEALLGAALIFVRLNGGSSRARDVFAQVLGEAEAFR